jgi:hypothetical protein
MMIRRFGRCNSAVVLLVVCTALTAIPYAQESPSQPGDAMKAAVAELYADAHPYMDKPVPELKKMVPELGGLKPAASPESVPDLLAEVAAKADELLRKVPDLISDEGCKRRDGLLLRDRHRASAQVAFPHETSREEIKNLLT